MSKVVSVTSMMNASRLSKEIAIVSSCLGYQLAYLSWRAGNALLLSLMVCSFVNEQEILPRLQIIW